MSIVQLRYFWEVVATGSIREASERLNVAPSAVSRQIQNIEGDIGLPLFERHPRGMRLTAAGEIYAKHAQQILLEMERVRSDIRDLKGLRRGMVRVHAVEGIVADCVAPAIAAFHRTYPGVSVHLTVAGSELVETAVRESETDVGIAFNAQPHPEISFVSQLSDRLLAVAAATHPIASMPHIDLAEVFKYPIAVPEPWFGIRMLIDQQCRFRKLHLDPILVSNSMEALRGFARFGSGVSILTFRAIEREAREGILVGIPFAEPVFQQATVDICVRAGRQLPKAASEFIKQIATVWST
jgi:DNA-binding transcriptional LysR family regulator